MDKKVQELMHLLDCTEEQAKQVIADDKAVDRMKDSEVNSDLTAEQKAVAKKYRQGDRKPTVYKFDTRERKVDNAKRELINKIAKALEVDTSAITNPERQIDFEYQGRKFRIVLSAPRK